MTAQAPQTFKLPVTIEAIYAREDYTAGGSIYRGHQLEGRQPLPFQTKAIEAALAHLASAITPVGGR